MAEVPLRELAQNGGDRWTVRVDNTVPGNNPIGRFQWSDLDGSWYRLAEMVRPGESVRVIYHGLAEPRDESDVAGSQEVAEVRDFLILQTHARAVLPGGSINLRPEVCAVETGRWSHPKYRLPMAQGAPAIASSLTATWINDGYGSAHTADAGTICRMLPKHAVAQGYTLDTSCYPWIGRRAQSVVECWTAIEAELISAKWEH